MMTEVRAWSGCVVGPNRQEFLAELGSVISSLLPQPKPILESTDLIAWCSKEFSASFPPGLGEEILVLAKTTESKWVLAHLCSGHVEVVGECIIVPGARWASGPHAERPWKWFPVQWYKLCDHEPSEREIIEFTLSTNFGNNEFRQDIRVLAVVLFDKNQHRLRTALQRGVGRRQIRARRRRYTWATGHLDWEAIERDLEQ